MVRAIFSMEVYLKQGAWRLRGFELFLRLLPTQSGRGCIAKFKGRHLVKILKNYLRIGKEKLESVSELLELMAGKDIRELYEERLYRFI
jgi:hypothetical protein